MVISKDDVRLSCLLIILMMQRRAQVWEKTMEDSNTATAPWITADRAMVEYVHKYNRSSDVEAADGIRIAVQTCLSDPEAFDGFVESEKSSTR